ncbi:hypothetical protein CC78DRAFT_532703 [Lojkania enalia]|uniref:Uncharacterized protein n=1 Tax=Lojkania enalia TaxID=147567 RepID=A0A9P4KBA8_9PLEO|nr:hypothetical protein CC78DRAFT_532703 [Didymosphaeria enalia]
MYALPCSATSPVWIAAVSPELVHLLELQGSESSTMACALTAYHHDRICLRLDAICFTNRCAAPRSQRLPEVRCPVALHALLRKQL